MADHDELIAQFIDISGGEENVARFYLSSSNWSLEDALSNFLGNQADEGMSEAAGGVPEEQTATDLSETKTSSSEGGNFGKGTSGAKPRFATLGDMSKRNSSNDDEEGQAFYAGGSDRSGQQVLGPPKRKNFREQLTDMFRMAQENSAGVDSAPAPSTSSGASWGQGIRLGMTDSDHSVVTPSSKEGEKTKPVVVLKLWSQGFSIDDGELRLYDDPQNKEFLETVMRGEIPNELLEMGWLVNVDVEDHRHEDYKKKPTTVKTFKGSGHALGSPTPNITENTTDLPSAASASADAPTDTKACDEAAKKKLKVDTSAPTTTLQIRLADGTRLASQFNLSHTVGDIQEYIQTARPQYANRNFILVSSFPTRELTDVSATIESAGLKNAALMQRLK
ncbi:NSFL1 cofactor p47 isoform X1 [Lucilia cuprina]|uniref:NSFL1 cofactor p47 isoform X1 n=1 Tax=Lucilia cuprina TaxID=7375 RepID=UPI001F066DCF|nr:NSFL1 cofactor p47 isoform X1 [Lucilia cuprina]